MLNVIGGDRGWNSVYRAESTMWYGVGVEGWYCNAPVDG